MLEIVRGDSAYKWMIAGCLATHDVRLGQDLKSLSNMDVAKVFSSDKTITCVADGFDLAGTAKIMIRRVC